MYLVSTGKATILSDFADLETKSVYQNANGESTDFQFYQKQRIFVAVNQKSGLEILRIKDHKELHKLEIQRIRKLNIENVICVACARQSMEEVALGLHNGQVRLYNYKTAEQVHRFPADVKRTGVLFLDYSASDEQMAGVFENGLINIYGIKTKTKMDTINIDGESSLARFHPTKRFQLGIASLKGGVTAYDVQAKRKLYHCPEAHGAPCRDLCMSAACPDTLISVGYDCLINIFDIRRKTPALKLTYCHPLSSVAQSECGVFFSVGNLKGELITYDMRNTRKYLAFRKIHEGAVTRVAFVPQDGDDSATSFSTSTAVSAAVTEEMQPQRGAPPPAGGDLRKSIVANMLGATEGLAANVTRARDSFCDFLDFQANKGLEKMSSRFTTRRDSFDWEALSRKPSNEEKRGSSLCRTASGSGSGSLNGSSGQLEACGSGTPAAADSFEMSICESVNTQSRHKRHKPAEVAASPPKVAPLRERNNALPQRGSGSLKQISEEAPAVKEPAAGGLGPNKENPDLAVGRRLSSLGGGPCNSTPHKSVGRQTIDGFTPAAVKMNSSGLTAGPDEVSRQLAEFAADMQHQMQQMRQEMQAGLAKLEGALKFNAETNKWQLLSQSSHMWSRHDDHVAYVTDALGLLLQTDPFVAEHVRLQQENALLKQKLAEAMRK